MKLRIVLSAAVLALLLSGCSLFTGTYTHVTPHRGQTAAIEEEAVPADDYLQLRDTLCEIVNSGRESAIIYVTDYEQEVLKRTMDSAVRYARNSNPVGDYAVDGITYEAGTSGGRTAVAVSVTYRHNASEIQRIRHLKDMTEVQTAVRTALTNCDASLVMLIQEYKTLDFAQMVQDFSQQNPRVVMEMPKVAEGIYGTGMGRVVELTFTYENSRDSLRQMQAQVRPIFESAALYVSEEDDDNRKLSQLYAFLMERFDYQLDISLTPAYSLLRHGVGDSRAFAIVFADICRGAGLECLSVTGSRNGEPWTWNIVRDGESYYHVDLLQCREQGGFIEHLDADMTGYVWDYSGYPECIPAWESGEIQGTEETVPAE